MILDAKNTVGELIASHPEWAQTFERLGIDFCCGGKKTIAQACGELGLDLSQVAAQLAAVKADTSGHTEWTSASLSALCDHIEQVHHTYLKRELPRLEVLLDKIAHVHGQRHGELLELHEVFANLRLELEAHLAKEESILFPAIRGLETADAPSQFHCGGLGGPISVMEAEHDAAGKALARMRQLTADYSVPADGCATYSAAMRALEELERDLHQHIHKENSILFPAALARSAGSLK